MRTFCFHSPNPSSGQGNRPPRKKNTDIYAQTKNSPPQAEAALRRGNVTFQRTPDTQALATVINPPRQRALVLTENTRLFSRQQGLVTEENTSRFSGRQQRGVGRTPKTRLHDTRKQPLKHVINLDTRLHTYTGCHLHIPETSLAICSQPHHRLTTLSPIILQ